MTLLSLTSSIPRACRPCAAAAAVFAVILFSRSTYATCGDYLLHRSMDLDSAVSSPIDFGDWRQAEDSSHPAPHEPCDGPHCRQAPSVPAAPAAPLDLSTHSDPAFARMVAAGSPRFADRWDREVDPREETGYPDSIERPPRTS